MYQLKGVTDSRDVIERLDELQEERDSLLEIVATTQTDLHDHIDDLESGAEPNKSFEADVTNAELKLTEWDKEYKEELDALVDFCESCSNYNDDWSHGTPIVSEDEFTAFAMNLASDVCSNNNAWPFNHIAWDSAADELKSDYTLIRYDRENYYIRNT